MSYLFPAPQEVAHGDISVHSISPPHLSLLSIPLKTISNFLRWFFPSCTHTHAEVKGHVSSQRTSTQRCLIRTGPAHKEQRGTLCDTCARSLDPCGPNNPLNDLLERREQDTPPCGPKWTRSGLESISCCPAGVVQAGLAPLQLNVTGVVPADVPAPCPVCVGSRRAAWPPSGPVSLSQRFANSLLSSFISLSLIDLAAELCVSAVRQTQHR